MKEKKIGGRHPKHWIEQTAKETPKTFEVEGSITYEGVLTGNKQKTFPISYKGKKEDGALIIKIDGNLVWIPLNVEPEKTQDLLKEGEGLAHLVIYQEGELEVLNSVNRCDRCKEEAEDKEKEFCEGCYEEAEAALRHQRNREKIVTIKEQFGAAIDECEKWDKLNMPEKTKELYKNAPHIKDKKEELESLLTLDKKLEKDYIDKVKATQERAVENRRS